jgi:phage-related baseplate assembly protein
MATPKYADLIVPLTRTQIVETWTGVLKLADYPTDAWGPTDEPRATIEGMSEVLVDSSVMIAAIGKMGVLGTSASDGATGPALHLLAADWFGDAPKAAVTTKGTVTLIETANNPHTYAARELKWVSTADPSLVFFNESGFTLAALGTSSPVIVAESPGSKYNVQGSTIALATPVAGVTLTVGTALTWITTSGADEENDESLRTRLRAKFGAITSNGTADGYKYIALSASSEINRVKVVEDPTAVPPTPAVKVLVAGTAGAVSGAGLFAAATEIELRRPIGILVETANVSTTNYELRGDITIKTGTRATVEAKANALLGSWFGGTSTSINGDGLDGLQIGATIRVAQIIELVMSIPGVVSFVPKDGAGTVRVPGSGDTILGAEAVALLVLNTSTNWTWTEVA